MHRQSKARQAISSVDFLHYVLGSCSSVKELSYLLKSISIVGVPDPVTNTVAPLHWITTDRSGACTIVEPTSRGLEIIDNPIGVMANSPDFHWQMTNLKNYMQISPTQTEEISWDNIKLTPLWASWRNYNVCQGSLQEP